MNTKDRWTLYLAHSCAGVSEAFFSKMKELYEAFKRNDGLCVRWCGEYTRSRGSDSHWLRVDEDFLANAELGILVLDEPMGHVASQLLDLRSNGGEAKALWAFTPRSQRIEDAVAQRIFADPEAVLPGGIDVQDVFPYDSTDDVVRMVSDWLRRRVKPKRV